MRRLGPDLPHGFSLDESAWTTGSSPVVTI